MSKSSFPLSRFYRLIEPGPVVLISSIGQDVPNVMAMSWHMMIDFEPPLPGCVIGGATEAIVILETRPDIATVFIETEIHETMVGLQLAHSIRDRWPPVMLIMASGKPDFVGGGLPAGTKFFPKPYSSTAVVEAMARVVQFPAL